MVDALSSAYPNSRTMKKHISQFSGLALMVLILGCGRAPEPQAKAHEFGLDEQLMAVLPLVDEGAVLKVCADDKAGNLRFSFLAATPDPANPGQTVAADPIPMEKQLTAILQVVDEHHMVKIHRETDEASGEMHLIFSIERKG